MSRKWKDSMTSGETDDTLLEARRKRHTIRGFWQRPWALENEDEEMQKLTDNLIV